MPNPKFLRPPVSAATCSPAAAARRASALPGGSSPGSAKLQLTTDVAASSGWGGVQGDGWGLVIGTLRQRARGSRRPPWRRGA